MKHSLEEFNILCEQLQSKFLTQKKHGFLHNLRPFARKKVYLEEDFMELWNTSAFKKMKYAFQGANLKFKFNQKPIDVQDVYVGTARPGLLVKYKVDQSYQKYLITELLFRLKENADNDFLTSWRAFIQSDIQTKNFSLPMEIHVISQVIPKPNQSFQNDKNIQIHQFNHAGYDGNIYIWFDFQKYKKELSSKVASYEDQIALDKLIKQQQEKSQQVTLNPHDQEDIHLTDPLYDKIKIGTFKISIKDSDKQGAIGLAKHFAAGDIANVISLKVAKPFNRLRGKGDMKDKSEDPDFIRKRIGLYDTSKPFVECISNVILENWLYNLAEDPQKKHLGSSVKKTGITAIVKLPFDLKKIKRTGDPLLSDDLYTNQCWSAGEQQSAFKWDRKPVTKEWLKNTSFDKHILVLKFQSWVKAEQGYYFEYRININLTDYYTLAIDIENLKTELSECASSQNAKKQKISKQIRQKQLQLGNFDTWFNNYLKQNIDGIDKSKAIEIQKSVFDSKGNMVNKDGPVKFGFAEFKGRDMPAYYFMENLLNKDWTCQGENFHNIMNSL